MWTMYYLNGTPEALQQINRLNSVTTAFIFDIERIVFLKGQIIHNRNAWIESSQESWRLFIKSKNREEHTDLMMKKSHLMKVVVVLSEQ